MKYPKYLAFCILVSFIFFSAPWGTGAQNPSLNNTTIPLAFGQTLPSALRAGETKTFTFAGTAGDRVIIRVCKTSGRLNPAIHLQGPDGTKLKEAWSAGITELISDALPSTGTFLIIAKDHWGIYEGEFNLGLVRLNPQNGASISFGQTVSGAIAAGELRSYTFLAAAEDRILIRVILTSATNILYPQIRLFNPEGIKLQEEWALSVAEFRIDVLPSAGTYTILVNDYFGIFDGQYNLILERFNPAGGNSGQAISTLGGR
jgi:hypothetical protein